MLNLQIAKAYLAGTDTGSRHAHLAERRWTKSPSTKTGANQHRWQTAAKDKAFDP